MKFPFLIGAAVIFLVACQGSKSIQKSHVILNKDSVFNLSVNSNDSITIHYIGCTGFFIKKGNDIILIDPYFSNRHGRTYVSGSILKESTISNNLKGLINSVFLHTIGDTVDHSGLIKALLITHAHVDHYGDVPYLFHSKHLNNDSVKIIGSSTTQHYLIEDKIPTKNIVTSIEPATDSTEGKWIYVNSKMRVLPIVSEHAPHFKIAGKNFNVTPENVQTKKHPKFWRQYAAGKTVCYLIDYLNGDGSVNFRMYLNSAASNAPYGFPPRSLLNQHPVDVAMLCVASYQNSKNYPEDIVTWLTPKSIIACHWEDFINYSIPELKEKPKEVFATNVNEFFNRLDRIVAELNSDIVYIQPNVNTTINFFYSNSIKEIAK
ncbi:MAG: hypothetical protein V4608_08395 [Bacteroidota bacterium]